MQQRNFQVSRLVYLALGTNLGSRLRNLQKAIDQLGPYVAIEAISPVYETEPWGIQDQPLYLNICLSGRTTLSPVDLLTAAKDVEKSVGREPGVRWGPRIIDIDIIFYGDKIVDQQRLKVPHPRYNERVFVLAPLADLSPEYRDPVSGKSVSEQLDGLDGSSVKKLTGNRRRLRRPTKLAWGAKTYVMGILNSTPDSFSGDGIMGRSGEVAEAVNKASLFEEAGADVIDIGGQSTRPGSKPVPVEEELSRVIPVIKAVREVVSVPLSVDTYIAEVAHASLEAGADWINDVWGLRMDPQMVSVAASNRCPIVIMHNRSRPKSIEQRKKLGAAYVAAKYESLFSDIKRELTESIRLGLEGGIEDEQIIIDPGIGFGKSIQQNIKLITELHEFKSLGYPILVGPSRKSFIGYILDLPPEDRVEGTAATVAIAIDRGADIVRVHDVKEMVRVSRMTDRLVRNNLE